MYVLMDTESSWTSDGVFLNLFCANQVLRLNKVRLDQVSKNTVQSH